MPTVTNPSNTTVKTMSSMASALRGEDWVPPDAAIVAGQAQADYRSKVEAGIDKGSTG
jgi:hypothetical protein